MKIVIAVPCYNEEKILEKNIKEIFEAVKNLPHDIKIVISDNNSKDSTAEIGKRFAMEFPNIDYIYVGEPGKGAAVLDAWKKYEADVYGFIDADLSTDLEALPRAIAEIAAGNDAAVASRRIAGAEVSREPYRKFTSAVLNFLIKIILKTKINDTPCGFKFFSEKIIKNIVPQVKDKQWVFDTEIIILAERAGYKIKEIPIKWEEKGERQSKVNIYPTARAYIKKIFDLRRRI